VSAVDSDMADEKSSIDTTVMMEQVEQKLEEHVW
jgi:hypothetical protein